MSSHSFKVTAPALGLPGHSEAEVLGAVTWLWLHSARHRELPLMALSQTLLTPLKAQQYILASADDGAGGMRPVAYLAWANLSAEAERRYLQCRSSALLPVQDWTGGDRMWMTDWVAPFGHTAQFGRLVTALLPESCFRLLYHRGDERGVRVKALRGDHVSRAQADAWWQDRPLAMPGDAA
jgi:cytolysin-activating lysine-acyltransferase